MPTVREIEQAFFELAPREGAMDWDNVGHLLGDRYLIEKIIRLQGAVAGLNRSAAAADREKADGLRDILTALLAMREEWRHANGT